MTTSEDKGRMLADIEYLEQQISKATQDELYENATHMYNLAVRNMGKITGTPDEPLKPRYMTLVNYLVKYLPAKPPQEKPIKENKLSQIMTPKDGTIDNLAKKGIITLAIGEKFNRQAIFLAYSCILHSPSIPRAIITDNCDYFSELYDIVIPYSEDMGDPFKVKLRLQHYSPFYETLFLDSDTLVYTDLHFLWDYFGEQSIVYTGSCLTKGEWSFKKVEEAIEYFHVPWVGQLNSGVFLFRKDEMGLKVLNYAEKIHGEHDGIHVPFFRDKMLPDEPFLAVAFGKYNQLPTNEFGRMGYTMIDAHSVKLDIIHGIAKFIKRGQLVFPAVVHFCCDKEQRYIKEKLKLLDCFKDWCIDQNIFTKDV